MLGAQAGPLAKDENNSLSSCPTLATPQHHPAKGKV